MIHNDIDLLHAPTTNVLAQLEYLEEMNVEREMRINQLKEVDARRERRMRELEEVLVMMQSCHCQQNLCLGSRENPIKVRDVEYAEEYLALLIAPFPEYKEEEIVMVSQTTALGAAYQRLFRLC